VAVLIERGARESRSFYMRGYDKSMEMNETLARVAGPIGRCDRDLLDQMKRAAMGVPLNIGEALGLAGGNREVRFRTALGSAREVRACLDVAAAWGCTAARDAEVVLVVDQVIGMLVNLVRAR
jgi:four helix bundle protein